MDHTYYNQDSADKSSAISDVVETGEHSYAHVLKNESTKQCHVCDKTLSCRQSLYKHLLRVHGIKNQENLTVRCLEVNCSMVFPTVDKLRIHLNDSHSLVFEQEEQIFSEIAEFENWKTGIEEKLNVRFVRNTGVHYSGSVKTQYFSCNRSGSYKDKSTLTNGLRQRRMKSQGTCKLGNQCTSSIITKKNENDNSMRVIYHKTHYGHSTDELQHIFISKTDKENIASQLLQGVSVNSILDKIRESVTTNFQRIHLLSRKDIQRIEQCYGVSSAVQKDKNDLISVDMWVEENRNYVLYYKEQGKEHSVLEKNDFALAIMTPAQEVLLKHFGTNIICMDATHGTNPYDFHLVTVMVVDDFGEGFPVAFLYSNREDEIMLRLFIEAMKMKTGPIHCQTFMSDDASQYYNAWSYIMGGYTRKLLCSWHVDRAWKGKLNVIKDNIKKAEIYKCIKLLQNETNRNVFNKLMDAVKTKFLTDEDLSEFGKYFLTYYGNRVDQWAYCYRLNCGINTNMFLEALHKVIKHVYWNGRVVKRLDNSIYTLMKLVRDKQFSRIIKLIKGKNTVKGMNILNAHTKATKIPSCAVQKIEEGWLVESQQDFISKYIVTTTEESFHEKTQHKCEFGCSICDSCVHQYSCMCTNFLIQGNMCKHIHAVCISLQQNKVVTEVKASCGSSQVEELQSHLESLAKEETLVDQKKETLINLFRSFITKTASETDPNKLDRILEHAKSINTLYSIPSSTFNDPRVPSKLEPSNKKIRLQNTFLSTKRKRKANQDDKQLHKADLFESIELKSELLSQSRNVE